MINTAEKFLRKFDVDVVAEHNLRCEMVAQAIKAIGDSVKITHGGGTCWCHPKTNRDGYGYTHVLRQSRITSRLVLCIATGKPYDYHNEADEFMVASHHTPVICRHRNCLNPDHLYWETSSESSKRREAEKRAHQAASTLASELTRQSVTTHSVGVCMV